MLQEAGGGDANQRRNHAAVRNLRHPGGLIVSSEFPKTGLWWDFGLLLGIDFTSQGLAWLSLPSLPRRR
jgi:hypothetical protein